MPVSWDLYSVLGLTQRFRVHTAFKGAYSVLISYLILIRMLPYKDLLHDCIFSMNVVSAAQDCMLCLYCGTLCLEMAAANA